MSVDGLRTAAPAASEQEARLLREYQDAHLRYLRLLPAWRSAVFGRPILRRPDTQEMDTARRYLMQARAALLAHWATSTTTSVEVEN